MKEEQINQPREFSCMAFDLITEEPLGMFGVMKTTKAGAEMWGRTIAKNQWPNRSVSVRVSRVSQMGEVF